MSNLQLYTGENKIEPTRRFKCWTGFFTSKVNHLTLDNLNTSFLFCELLSVDQIADSDFKFALLSHLLGLIWTIKY